MTLDHIFRSASGRLFHLLRGMLCRRRGPSAFPAEALEERPAQHGDEEEKNDFSHLFFRFFKPMAVQLMLESGGQVATKPFRSQINLTPTGRRGGPCHTILAQISQPLSRHQQALPEQVAVRRLFFDERAFDHTMSRRFHVAFAVAALHQ